MNRATAGYNVTAPTTHPCALSKQANACGDKYRMCSLCTHTPKAGRDTEKVEVKL